MTTANPVDRRGFLRLVFKPAAAPKPRPEPQEPAAALPAEIPVTRRTFVVQLGALGALLLGMAGGAATTAAVQGCAQIEIPSESGISGLMPGVLFSPQSGAAPSRLIPAAIKVKSLPTGGESVTLSIKFFPATATGLKVFVSDSDPVYDQKPVKIDHLDWLAEKEGVETTTKGFGKVAWVPMKVKGQLVFEAYAKQNTEGDLFCWSDSPDRKVYVIPDPEKTTLPPDPGDQGTLEGQYLVVNPETKKYLTPEGKDTDDPKQAQRLAGIDDDYKPGCKLNQALFCAPVEEKDGQYVYQRDENNEIVLWTPGEKPEAYKHNYAFLDGAPLVSEESVPVGALAIVVERLDGQEKQVFFLPEGAPEPAPDSPLAKAMKLAGVWDEVERRTFEAVETKDGGKEIWLSVSDFAAAGFLSARAKVFFQLDPQGTLQPSVEQQKANFAFDYAEVFEIGE